MRARTCGNSIRGVSVELAAPLVPWLRERHWVAVDGLVAAALLGVLVGGALTRTGAFGAPGWLSVAACVLAAAPVAVRRRWPVPAFAVVLAGNAVLAALDVGGNPAVVVALALYTVAVRHAPRRSLVPLAVALGVSVPAEVVPLVTGTLRPEASVGATLITASVLVLTAAWALGLATRARRLYTARTAEQHTRRAVGDERLRIARELHDVVTHSMTLITVTASVASYLTESRPEEVRAALDVIESTGRGALTEMRRMLGVLRSDGAATGTDDQRAPAPGLPDVSALAERTTAAGVPVDLDIRGDGELPTAVALSAYRIVQEALTNVVRHAAPARCRVRIDIGDADVVIDVTDDGHRHPRAGGGHGIIGMRERVALFGGRLDAGPMPHGGFRVTARLPLASAEPAGTP
jgi:signal transduction histidine kinase